MRTRRETRDQARSVRSSDNNPRGGIRLPRGTAQHLLRANQKCRGVFPRLIGGAINTCFNQGVEMPKGTVKWFNAMKGYGFIQPSGGGGDVFVHISAVERAGLNSLNEGQAVEFEVVQNRGKSSAENLKVSR
jgi:CspA family cold shock protein